MIPKIEAQNLFADTKLPSFESEFVRSWLGWDESVAEDIQLRSCTYGDNGLVKVGVRSSEFGVRAKN